MDVSKRWRSASNIRGVEHPRRVPGEGWISPTSTVGTCPNRENAHSDEHRYGHVEHKYKCDVSHRARTVHKEHWNVDQQRHDSCVRSRAVRDETADHPTRE